MPDLLKTPMKLHTYIGIYIWLLLGITVFGEDYALQQIDDDMFVRIAKEKLEVAVISIDRVDTYRIGHTSESNLVVITGDYAQPQGYRGPSSLILLTTPEVNEILSAALVESCDSPAYIQRLLKKGFLNRLCGMNISSDHNIKVDAVTGATRTSTAMETAVIQTINTLKELQGSGITDVRFPTNTE